MSQSHEQFDVVRLTEPVENAEVGLDGAIVEVFNDGTCLLEFISDDDELWIVTAKPSQFEVITRARDIREMETRND